LRAVGYGRLQAVRAVAPTAKANEVTYVRSGLSEWYRNGPLGLEQGFTIPRAPPASRDGPLTLALALSDNAQAALSADAQGVTLGHAGAPPLRYTGLLATDARGHTLRSRLELRAGQLLLQVDARGARYPLRIDPFIQQGGKLRGGSEETGHGTLGASVALSSDGNTALIGGPTDSSNVGAVWVFTRSGEAWNQQGAKLTDGEAASHPACPPECGGMFGASVALSADADTALIGEPAYVQSQIVEIEGEVTEGSAIIKGLLSTSGIGAGMSVAFPFFTFIIRTHVSRVINEHELELQEPVPGEGGKTIREKLTFSAFHRGAAWVFTRSNGIWTQQGPKLTGKEEIEAGFGSSVALSTDGNTALVGGPSDDIAGTLGGLYGLGAAWIFTRSEGGWTQQGPKLVAHAEGLRSERFGDSLALSGDGNTALISAPYNRSVIETEGEVTEGSKIVKGLASTKGIAQPDSVFGTKLDRFGNTQVAKVISESEIELTQAVQGEGKATVKEKLTFWTGFAGGVAFVFTRSGGAWSQAGKPLTQSGFGSGGIGAPRLAVALSADGGTALIGGPADNGGIGAAWVFTRSQEAWSEQGPKLTGGKEQEGSEFGHSVALSSDGDTALIGSPPDNGVLGAAWLFTRTGEGWSQQGPKLTGKEEVKQGGFGASVALSADGRTALIGGPGDNGGLGAAWVFVPEPPPPSVAIGAPGEGTLTSQATPTFTWSAGDLGGPGIVRIEFLLDGKQVSGDPLSANATSYTSPSPLPDGTHTWQVRAVDSLGFTTTTAARTITIDTTPPTTPALAQPLAGGRIYQAVPSFSWVASSDATSGVGYYTLLIDGGLAATVSPGACQGGTCTLASPRALSNGSHTWQVLATDRAGNTAASATQGFVVAVGPTPPPGPVGISIDHGDYATNTPHVVLDIVWPRGANRAFLSNDGGFNLAGETALVPVAPEIPWTLRSVGSERLPKTVYLRFPESADPTSTFTDDIILDTTTPVIHSAKLLGSDKRKHPSSYRVRLRASEGISGISAAQFSDTRSGGEIVTFRSRKERGLLSISEVIILAGAHGSAARAHLSASAIKPRPPHRPRWVRMQSAASTWSPWRRLS
jgi:hypothetical protein